MSFCSGVIRPRALIAYASIELEYFWISASGIVFELNDLTHKQKNSSGI